MKFSPHFSETPSVLIQKVITNGLINEVAILLLTFYPWILFGCCEMVAGAFPQQSLKISPKKDHGQNYLNCEAKVLLT